MPQVRQRKGRSPECSRCAPPRGWPPRTPVAGGTAEGLLAQVRALVAQQLQRLVEGQPALGRREGLGVAVRVALVFAQVQGAHEGLLAVRAPVRLLARVGGGGYASGGPRTRCWPCPRRGPGWAAGRCAGAGAAGACPGGRRPSGTAHSHVGLGAPCLHRAGLAAGLLEGLPTRRHSQTRPSLPTCALPAGLGLGTQEGEELSGDVSTPVCAQEYLPVPGKVDGTPKAASQFALESPPSTAGNESLGGCIFSNNLCERAPGRAPGAALAPGQSWLWVIFDSSLPALGFFPGTAEGFFPASPAPKESEKFSSSWTAGCCHGQSGLSCVTWELPLGWAW